MTTVIEMGDMGDMGDTGDMGHAALMPASSAGLPPMLPPMLDPTLSAMSSSIFLLRDLILADQLPHFRAPPEVRSLLHSPSGDISHDALRVLSEAADELAVGTQPSAPAPLSTNSSLRRSEVTIRTAEVRQNEPRRPRKIPCRATVTVRCEDSWRGTFHNAQHHLSTITIASGRSIYSPTSVPADDDNESTLTLDEHDYYSSNWETSDDEVSYHDNDADSMIVDLPHSTSKDTDSMTAANLQQFDRSHTSTLEQDTSLAPGQTSRTASTLDSDESDYAPPSAELGDVAARTVVDRSREDVSGRDDYKAGLSISIRKGLVSNVPDTSPQHRRPYDSTEPTQYVPGHSTQSISNASVTTSSRHAGIYHASTDHERGPRKKRRRHDQDGGYAEETYRPGKNKAGTANPRVRPTAPLEYATGMTEAQRAPPVIPPPDLAAVQAYANYQAQSHLLQPGVLQQTHAAGALVADPGQVVHPPPTATPGIQYVQTHAATAYSAGVMPRPQPLPVDATPHGYILVRDQFGNAWYARPVQPSLPPVYNMGQIPFM